MKFLLISIILQITSYSFALKPHNTNLKLQHNNINITSNNHYKSSKNLLNMCVNIPNDITTIDIDNTHNFVIGHSIPSTSLTTDKHHTPRQHHTIHNSITNSKPFYYRFIPKKLIVISIIIIWYILSTLYNISNKKSIEFLRGFPYTLAMIQMAVGAFIILSKDIVQILYTYIPHIPYTSYIHSNKHPPSPSSPLPRPKRTYSETSNHYKRLIVKYKEPALYHTLSHTTTVLALNYGTLSFTQLIKGM